MSNYTEDAARIEGIIFREGLACLSCLDLMYPKKLQQTVMSGTSKEQIDTHHQQKVFYYHQRALPAKDKRPSVGNGIVQKRNNRYQRNDIIKEAVKPVSVTQFLFHVIGYCFCDQSAMEATPKNP
jgi:hypothetical protein